LVAWKALKKAGDDRSRLRHGSLAGWDLVVSCGLVLLLMKEIWLSSQGW